GGEPTAHPRELERLAAFVKEQGLLVGIETNGYYPERLKKMIEMRILDKIFLDIKAPPGDKERYRAITGGIRDAPEKVQETLNLRDVEIEVRTTVFPSFASSIHDIAE
ncbi:MAG: radical SAM protein, partial [Candidatus Methanoperedens sp.]|nr:radical SAM protein [Candidatus Methanoperedens sp.]